MFTNLRRALLVLVVALLTFGGEAMASTPKGFRDKIARTFTCKNHKELADMAIINFNSLKSSCDATAEAHTQELSVANFNLQQCEDDVEERIKDAEDLKIKRDAEDDMARKLIYMERQNHVRQINTWTDLHTKEAQEHTKLKKEHNALTTTASICSNNMQAFNIENKRLIATIEDLQLQAKEAQEKHDKALLEAKKSLNDKLDEQLDINKILKQEYKDLVNLVNIIVLLLLVLRFVKPVITKMIKCCNKSPQSTSLPVSKAPKIKAGMTTQSISDSRKTSSASSNDKVQEVIDEIEATGVQNDSDDNAPAPDTIEPDVKIQADSEVLGSNDDGNANTENDIQDAASQTTTVTDADASCQTESVVEINASCQTDAIAYADASSQTESTAETVVSDVESEDTSAVSGSDDCSDADTIDDAQHTTDLHPVLAEHQRFKQHLAEFVKRESIDVPACIDQINKTVQHYDTFIEYKDEDWEELVVTYVNQVKDKYNDLLDSATEYEKRAKDWEHAYKVNVKFYCDQLTEVKKELSQTKETLADKLEELHSLEEDVDNSMEETEEAFSRAFTKINERDGTIAGLQETIQILEEQLAEHEQTNQNQ